MPTMPIANPPSSVFHRFSPLLHPEVSPFFYCLSHGFCGCGTLFDASSRGVGGLAYAAIKGGQSRSVDVRFQCVKTRVRRCLVRWDE
ncbi:unnamed protein product, partial [Ectocarpus sp. 13 AM-2016]